MCHKNQGNIYTDGFFSSAMLLSMLAPDATAQSSGDLFTTRTKTIAAQRQYVLFAFPILLSIAGVAPEPGQAVEPTNAPQAEQPCPQELCFTKAEIIEAQRKFLCERFLDDAKEEVKKGFPGKAEAYLLEAEKVAHELKQDDLTLKALHDQGRFYRDLKMPEHARNSFAKAYEIFVRHLRERRMKDGSSKFGSLRFASLYSEMLPEYAEVLESLNSKELAKSIRMLSTRVEMALAKDRTEWPAPVVIRHYDGHLEADWGPYMADAIRKISAKWIPLQSDLEAGKVVAKFKISSDGSISNTYLSTTSPSWTANQAVLKSIESVHTFRPLPPGAPKEVDAQFTFNQPRP